MFSDIKSTPNLIQRVRYSKAKQEETAEWEEKKVHIYNYINDLMDDSQLGGGKQIENQPAANKVSARFAKLSRRVLYILILAWIISLTMYFTLEIIKLKNTHSHLSEMAAQLTDQVNRLNNTITGKQCPDGWTRFGSSCYFKGKEKKTWDNSRTYCQQRGADLVIINSDDEQEFIKQFNKNGESWIGLQGTRQWINGQRTYVWNWKWVDESPLTKTFWGTGWSTSYNYESYGVCCNSVGKWIQVYLYDYKNWICEK